MTDVEMVSDRNGHDVIISGEWHNDNTGGISIWCSTCRSNIFIDSGVIIADGNDDYAKVEKLYLIVAAHTIVPQIGPKEA